MEAILRLVSRDGALGIVARNLGLSLAILLFVVAGLAYVLRGMRLQRAERSQLEAAAALGSLDQALEGLDADTRRQILEKLESEKKRVRTGFTPEPAKRRGDDYMR